MITKFKQYLLLLEKFEDNQIKKIKKFANVPEIYNWAINFSPKFSVWFANIVKDLLIEEYKNLPVMSDNTKPEETLHKFLKGENPKPNSYSAIKNSVRIYTQGREYLNKYNTILDWFRSPLRTENEDLYKLSLDEAYKKSVKWHDSLSASGAIANEDGVVFMNFDDGYYWIDLETNNCRDEGNAMGHCGSTNGDTLLSLRKNQEPHITIAYNYQGYILQAKGKNNTKPVNKFHKYIIELLCYPNVNPNVKIINNPTAIGNNNYHIKGFNFEYNPDDDFNMNDLDKDEIKYIYSKNPEIFNNNFGLKYFLYREKLITKEKLIENNPYKDLIFKDGEIYFVLGSWSNITSYKKDRDKKDGWQTDILSGDDDWWGNYDKQEFDYSYYWGSLSQGAYKAIKEKVIGLTINIDDEDFVFDENNTIISEKDIKIKFGEDEISLGDILDDGSNDYEIESGELDDIRDSLGWSITSVQESADRGEAYTSIVKAIESTIGYALTDNENHVVWDKEHNGMLIKVDLGLISDLSQLPESDGETTVLGLINDVLEYYEDGDKLIDVDTPYYGWNGTIDKLDLSDEIENRL